MFKFVRVLLKFPSGPNSAIIMLRIDISIVILKWFKNINVRRGWTRHICHIFPDGGKMPSSLPSPPPEFLTAFITKYISFYHTVLYLPSYSSLSMHFPWKSACNHQILTMVRLSRAPEDRIFGTFSSGTSRPGHVCQPLRMRSRHDYVTSSPKLAPSCQTASIVWASKFQIIPVSKTT